MTKGFSQKPIFFFGKTQDKGSAGGGFNRSSGKGMNS